MMFEDFLPFIEFVKEKRLKALKMKKSEIKAYKIKELYEKEKMTLASFSKFLDFIKGKKMRGRMHYKKKSLKEIEEEEKEEEEKARIKWEKLELKKFEKVNINSVQKGDFLRFEKPEIKKVGEKLIIKRTSRNDAIITWKDSPNKWKEEFYEVIEIFEKTISIKGIYFEQKGSLRKKDIKRKDLIVEKLDLEQVERLKKYINSLKSKNIKEWIFSSIHSIRERIKVLN